ncbi:MAG: hypothetical protein V3U87_11355 [Methylococcaceae bacterium]
MAKIDNKTQGEWLPLIQTPGFVADGLPPKERGTVAVHAVLLHTGKVLMWSGRLEGWAIIYAAWTWDPEDGESSDALPFDGKDYTIEAWRKDKDCDLFCSHHVVLPDGRVLAMGGGGGNDESKDPKTLWGHPGIYIRPSRWQRWKMVKAWCNESPTLVSYCD